MAAEIKINRRLHQRENVELIARYFIEGRSLKYRGCTIVDLSRNGAGALFPLKEKLEQVDFVLIDIMAPGTFEQLSVQGEIRRCYKKGTAVFGGIQFQAPLPEEVFRTLCGHRLP